MSFQVSGKKDRMDAGTSYKVRRRGGPRVLSETGLCPPSQRWARTPDAGSGSVGVLGAMNSAWDCVRRAWGAVRSRTTARAAHGHRP